MRHLMLATSMMLAAAQAAEEFAPPKDVEFTAAVDNSKQLYTELLPKNFDAKKEHHLLIALHGHGSDRTQYATQNRDECKGARDVAAKFGMIFISPDYRAKTSWMGPKAEADVVQIIAELKKKYRVGKVFLVGGSMGGTSVLIFAALHPDLIAGVSSQNGTANMVEYKNFLPFIAESYGGAKDKVPDEYRKRSPELFPEKFTMPVAITAGGKDTLVPPDSVLRLAESLKKKNHPSVLLIHRPDGGHSTNYEDVTKALEFVVTEALKKK